MNAASTGRKRSLLRIAFRESVWSSDDLTAAEKLVALAYEDHVGEDHDLDYVWVSRRRLMARTRLTTDRAQRAMRGLEAKGWLELLTEGIGKRAARYRLINVASSVPHVGNARSIPSVPDLAPSVPDLAPSVPHAGTEPLSIDPSPQSPPRRSRPGASTHDESRCSICHQPERHHGGHIQAYADHDYLQET